MAAARRTAAVLVSALLASCSFEAAFDGPGYRCDPDHACPDGTVCVGDTCQLASDSGDDGGGGGDGGDVDALLPGTIIERACPGTIIDQDAFDFESETRWYWFVNGNAEIAAMDGVAHADLHESNARAGLLSTGNYPLPDTAFAFRLPAPAPQDETYAAFEIISQDEATALLTIYRSSERIVAESTEVGMGAVIQEERLYDHSKQAVWRIRLQNQLITWETSPDGLAWTTLATAPPWPDIPDTVRLRILVETNDTSTTYQQDFDDMVVCAL